MLRVKLYYRNEYRYLRSNNRFLVELTLKISIDIKNLNRKDYKLKENLKKKLKK